MMSNISHAHHLKGSPSSVFISFATGIYNILKAIMLPSKSSTTYSFSYGMLIQVCSGLCHLTVQNTLVSTYHMKKNMLLKTSMVT